MSHSASSTARHGATRCTSRSSKPTRSGPRPRRAMERMLADEAGMRPGQSVLDVGCGTGGPAIAVAAHSGVHVTGIDLVPGHLERARAQAAAQDLPIAPSSWRADATDMPFPDASFDHVYAIESAYHARDKARFYSECARVLRPGGFFVGTDWLRGEQASDGRHAEILERLCEQFAIPSLIDLPTLRRHLTAAGLVADVVEDLARSRGRPAQLGRARRRRPGRGSCERRATPRRTPCGGSPTAPRRSPRPRRPELSSSVTGGPGAPAQPI